MNFQELLAKMQQLDQPAVESAPVVTDECGEMPPAPMGNMSSMGKPDTPPPSMSVNLNAQGLDNIEELLSLIKAVNPDAEKPAMPMGGMPHIEIEPMDKPEGGMPKLGGLGNLDSGPLKMLPDLDADNDDKVGGEKDHEEDEATDNRDAYQRDFDASQTGFGKPDREDDEGEDESFGNSVGDSEPEFKGPEASIPNGNDLNKQKKMFPKAQDGDNPMAVEGTDLRSQIRAELLRRLEEAKGAK